MDYFVNPGAIGSDANTGTHWTRPFKSLERARRAPLKPKDRILLQQGAEWRETLTVSVEGLTIAPYQVSGDSAARPLIRFATPITNAPIKTYGLSLLASGCTVTDLEIQGAVYGVYVADAAHGNTVQRVNVSDYGYGYLIHGSHTTVKDVSVERGYMVRDVGTPDYVGASAFTLWGHNGIPCVGTRIDGAFVDRAWAAAIATKDGDGSAVELFELVSDVVVEDMTVLRSKIVTEIGGTASKEQSMSNIVFKRVFSKGTGGKTLYTNDPAGAFAVNWSGVRFEQCTFLADEWKESPFYLAGNNGDLSKKLHVEGCVIVGTSQIYNGGAGTDLNSISRYNNLYWRSDGSTNVGVKLTSTERFEKPAFVDERYGDYRLALGHWSKGTVGALGQREMAERRTSSRLANGMIGGHHTAADWHAMHQIPRTERMAGMTCTLVSTGATYQLARDGASWLKL